MTTPQLLALGVIGLMMAVFIWDHVRYDLVACGALALSVIVGLVPADKAFSGFSDDIVIIVGSALVVSYGVARSGIVDLVIKRFFPNLQTVHAQIALLVLSVAILSAFIKNIGALAIMMPAAFQFARKSGKSPSLYLMPMSFGALLGGLMTQIGTSPNIVVSRLRQELTGESFTMFDFTPVGAALTVVGAAFLIVFHWILPERRNENPSIEESLDNKIYSTEATVTEESPINGRALSDLLQYSDREIVATAVIRGLTRMTPFPDLVLHAGDTIILEGSPGNLDRAVSGAKLKLQGSRALTKDHADLMSVEAVITRESPLVGLSARQLSLSNRRNVNLLAVSRQGHRLSERLSELVLREGDVIVLQGGRATLPNVLQDFACLPLAQRDITLGSTRRAYLPVIILAAAMGATAIGVASVPVAFFCSALAMVIFGVIPLADVYKALDGPILIMLAALIPVADTLRTSGASEILAHHLGELAHTMPSWGALTLILVTAMAVTPFLNNAATVLVMAPIAASFATTLDYRPDAFLMAVAIGAGCDFLTPIGHQCNTLVMGPGGYRFSDYPRLGLPLSFIVIVVSVPMLLWVWPVS